MAKITKQVSKPKNKMWKNGNPVLFHMLPALPGVVFVGLNFAMSTRSPNSLSSGFEGFPEGT